MYLQANSSGIKSTGLDFNDEDQLYQLAQQQGGAVAEAANELAHPNTGILSTVGNGFKNAFKGFIDVISIPSEIVAGAISDKYTVGQAIDQHFQINQAIFGDTPLFGQEGSQTTMQKVGGFIVRAPFDILLDPTTWLGFGAAGKAMKVKVLTEAGLAAKSKVTDEILSGALDESILEEAVRKNLKDSGVAFEDVESEVTKTLGSIDKTNLNDFVKKNYETIRMSQLEAESGVSFQSIKSLSPEGEKMVLKYAQAQKTGMEQTFIKSEAIQWMDNTGSTYDEAVEQVKKMINKKEYDTDFLKSTIDAPLDIENAKTAVANLISRKPHMMKDLIDKGGIKYLGRTILEGQRIESAIRALPMMHHIENYTQELRKTVFALSPESKEFSQIERRYADLSKSKKNEAIKDIINIFKQNKITGAEAEMITSAIEYGRMPIDENMKALYLNAHGIDYMDVYNNPRLSNAIRAVSNMNEINYQEAIARGIAVSRKDNYMSHLVPLEKLVKNNFSNISVHAKLKSAMQTTVLKFRNTETGELALSGKGNTVGFAEQFALKQYDPKAIVKLRIEALIETEKRYGIKIQDLEHETIGLQNEIRDFFVKKTLSDFQDLASKIPGSKSEDINSAMRVMKSSMDEMSGVDFAKMKETRKLARENAETSIGQALRSSPAKIQAAVAKVIENNQRISKEVPAFGEELSKTLEGKLANIDVAEIEKGLVSTADNGIIDAEAKAFIKQLKDANKAYSDELLKNSIDPDVSAKWLDKMVTEFESNPTGVKHLLDSMIGKDNKISKLLLEASEKRLALMKAIDKNSELALMDGKLYRSKEGAIFRAERPAIIEARAAGFEFEPNALAIMFRSSLDTVKATVSADFISDIATKFGRLESEAPDNWVEVSVSGLKDAPKNLSNYLTGKNGEKILFHPDIAKKIEVFHASVINDEDINAILKNFDKLTMIFKASVTSIFPSFHGRNAISNVLNSFLDIGYAALNPARHVMSSQIIKSSYNINALKAKVMAGDLTANAELYKELAKPAFTDRRGYVWSQGQIQQILKDKNIALGNQWMGRIDVENHHSVDQLPQLMTSLFGDATESTLKKGGRLGKEGVTKVFEGGQKFGQLIEDQSRIIHFLEHMDRTGDVGLAAERTKMFLFDYGDLSNFERTFMKRIIPFYTWIKKNVELQAKVLTTQPGRIAQEVHLFNTLSSTMSEGNGLTDEEYNQLPDYMKAQFKIVTSRNGQKLHVVSNLGSPLEAAFQAIQPKGILSSLNPFVKLPAELTTGYDVFRGGMMSDTNNARLLKDAPQYVKDLVGFVHTKYKDKDGVWHDRYTALNPKMFFFVMNQPMGSRIFKEYLTRKAPEFDGMSEEQILRTLTGMTSQDLDMEEISKQAQKKRVKEYQDILEKAGIIYKMNKPLKSKTSEIVED